MLGEELCTLIGFGENPFCDAGEECHRTPCKSVATSSPDLIDVMLVRHCMLRLRLRIVSIYKVAPAPPHDIEQHFRLICISSLDNLSMLRYQAEDTVVPGDAAL